MNTVRLQVISPKGVVYDGVCTMLEYNTSEGYVGVMPGHVAMTQILAPGRLAIYEENKEKPIYAAVMSGVATIMPDVITLLTEIIELKDEIDVERAKKSKERAEKRIEENLEGFDLARAKASLERAEVRIAVAEIK